MRKSEIHAAESVSCLNKALLELREIWEEIGIPEDQRLQRTDAVYMHIKNLLEMMIAEEEGLKSRLMTSIAACREEFSALREELQLPPYEEGRGLTMLQLEKDLRTQVKRSLAEKSSRVTELQELLQRDRDLCDLMSLEPLAPPAGRLPTPSQLQELREQVEERGREKERRHAQFTQLRGAIAGLMRDLELDPDCSFQRDVLCEDEDAFCLSAENIRSLHVLLGQLEGRQAEVEARCGAVWTRLQELWQMLQVPEKEREPFTPRDHSQGTTTSTSRLRMLQAELERLEELKRKNMARVIGSIRSEIARMWEKCYCSAEQRAGLTSYLTDDPDEEVLLEHERELERLRRDHEEHRELYDAVDTWSSNWALFQELEKKATDPSRFNNRGGNLLKEEKQRAELQKSLAKLEKSLRVRIEQWEASRGVAFRVSGRSFLQHVEEQWSQHHAEKEREKQERQMKKLKQTEEDLLYGTIIRTPTKRRLNTTATPGKTRKLISGSTPNTTLRSLCSSPSMRPPLSSSKLAVRTPRGHTLRNKENVSHLGGALRGVAASPGKNCSISSVASSYSEFAREIADPRPGVMTSLLNSTATR